MLFYQPVISPVCPRSLALAFSHLALASTVFARVVGGPSAQCSHASARPASITQEHLIQGRCVMDAIMASWLLRSPLESVGVRFEACEATKPPAYTRSAFSANFRSICTACSPLKGPFCTSPLDEPFYRLAMFSSVHFYSHRRGCPPPSLTHRRPQLVNEDVGSPRA